MFDNKKQKIKDVHTSPKIEHEKVTKLFSETLYTLYMYIYQIYIIYIFYLYLLSKYWIICYIYWIITLYICDTYSMYIFMYSCVLCIMVAFKQTRVFYGKINIYCGNCNIKQNIICRGADPNIWANFF